jgi:isopenicillin-N N-acyltransferase-like protein
MKTVGTTAFPFPLITIEGEPRERGRQYGRQAADRIDTSIGIYMAAWAAGDEAARRAVLARARAFVPVVAERYPELMEEVAGIAEGADRPVEEIVALNARTELLYGDRAADGCTGAALLPEVAGGHVVIGQNWDWRPACRDSAILLHVVPARGPALMTFVEAGMLARSGMNAAGIGLCGNFLNSDADFSQSGVPIPFVRRAILMSETLPAAVGQVLRSPRAFSSNHLLAHRDGEAIDLEASPPEVFPLFADDGIITHSNHFKAAAGRVRDTGVPRYPDTLFRDRRLRKRLGERDRPLGARDLMTALADHFGRPDSVCRHRAARPDGTEIETVASIVMDLTEGRLWLAPGPVCEHEYREFGPGAGSRASASAPGAAAPAPRG